jgi:hypothetical protein
MFSCRVLKVNCKVLRGPSRRWCGLAQELTREARAHTLQPCTAPEDNELQAEVNIEHYLFIEICKVLDIELGDEQSAGALAQPLQGQ